MSPQDKAVRVEAAGRRRGIDHCQYLIGQSCRRLGGPGPWQAGQQHSITRPDQSRHIDGRIALQAADRRRSRGKDLPGVGHDDERRDRRGIRHQGEIEPTREHLAVWSWVTDTPDLRGLDSSEVRVDRDQDALTRFGRQVQSGRAMIVFR